MLWYTEIQRRISVRTTSLNYNLIKRKKPCYWYAVHSRDPQPWQIWQLFFATQCLAPPSHLPPITNDPPHDNCTLSFLWALGHSVGQGLKLAMASEWPLTREKINKLTQSTISLFYSPPLSLFYSLAPLSYSHSLFGPTSMARFGISSSTRSFTFFVCLSLSLSLSLSDYLSFTLYLLVRFSDLSNCLLKDS